MGEIQILPPILPDPDPVTGNTHTATYRDYLTLPVIPSYERFSATFTTCSGRPHTPARQSTVCDPIPKLACKQLHLASNWLLFNSFVFL